MTPRRFGIAAATALVVLTGCLPYSCRRETSTDLFASDSLSRDLAGRVATDSLRAAWSVDGGPDTSFEHPRTVRFGPDGLVYAGDAATGLIYAFDTTGTFIRRFASTDVPYLAGILGDTIAVFEPSDISMQLFVGGERVETIRIDDPDRPPSALVYGAFDGRTFYKRIADEDENFIAEVRRDGSLDSRWSLEGPSWRHAGLLRLWGDSLVSLSGFRPVVDVVRPAGRIDTLALRGFDSPMLARSRSYVMGEVDEPPLLSASAAATGDRLFVLNMRAGWIRVDVYDRAGELVRTLSERSPTYQRAFFPQDVDVRRLDHDRFGIAVVLTEPRPELRMYVWDPQ